jgi:uncharacterized protein
LELRCGIDKLVSCSYGGDAYLDSQQEHDHEAPMSRPIHFEIHASDPARAIDFYELVMGWTFQRFGVNDYWLISTGGSDKPGINGGLVLRKGAAPDMKAPGPMSGFVCTMEVKDLETFEHAVVNAGGTIVVARHAIPGIGWLCYARDTEGNIFGLSQPDPAAA